MVVVVVEGGVVKKKKVCGRAEHHNRGGDISQLPVVTPGFTAAREQEAPAAARDKSSSCVDSPEQERRETGAAWHAPTQADVNSYHNNNNNNNNNNHREEMEQNTVSLR